MTVLSNNTGPDRGKLICSALRPRLMQHSGINPDKHADILTAAERIVTVRMGPRGWHVAEHDIEAFMRKAEQQPCWRRDEPARESPMDKLRRANQS